MQIRRLAAVFSPSGPNSFEDCAERIERSRYVQMSFGNAVRRNGTWL
jgi:hypothetical protein